MLTYFVSDLITAPPGTMRKVVIDEPHPDLGPELELAGPLRGTARIHRIQHGLLVQCDLSASVDCECARCLQPTTYEMHSHFDEAFRFAGHEVEPDGFRLSDQILDLTEPVRQYLVMELPINPVCRPDCRGLCPVCGEPLQDHECRVDSSSLSEPWGPLANLLQTETQKR
jgi:uncharacterized protein